MSLKFKEYNLNIKPFNHPNLGDWQSTRKGIQYLHEKYNILFYGGVDDIMVNENFDVKIIMTLTTPNCPVAETLPVDVEEKVKTVEGVKDVKVEITFEPAWSQDLMSDEAKLELGIL